jgi:NAD(P)-dependent dehydrogenase (short-subunit alcohol dehydrogenase family)
MSGRIVPPAFRTPWLTRSSISLTCIRFPRSTRSYSNLPTETKPRPTRVLITGGSRGIGLAIATAFSKTGNHSIQITGRNPDSLSEAVQSLQQSYKTAHPTTSPHDLSIFIKAHRADISDPQTWKSAFNSPIKHEEQRWETPDILINSAGITHSSLLMAMKSDSIQEIINTNLLGTIYACQAVSKAMIRLKRSSSSDARPRQSFCVINISSLLASHGGRGSSVYSASKAGVLGTSSFHYLI